MDEDGDVDETLGFNKVNDKKQVRVTDDALDEINCEPGDLLIFENCEHDEYVRLRKGDIGK